MKFKYRCRHCDRPIYRGIGRWNLIEPDKGPPSVCPVNGTHEPEPELVGKEGK